VECRNSLPFVSCPFLGVFPLSVAFLVSPAGLIPPSCGQHGSWVFPPSPYHGIFSSKSVVPFPPMNGELVPSPFFSNLLRCLHPRMTVLFVFPLPLTPTPPPPSRLILRGRLPLYCARRLFSRLILCVFIKAPYSISRNSLCKLSSSPLSFRDHPVYRCSSIVPPFLFFFPFRTIDALCVLSLLVLHTPLLWFQHFVISASLLIFLVRWALFNPDVFLNHSSKASLVSASCSSIRRRTRPSGPFPHDESFSFLPQMSFLSPF